MATPAANLEAAYQSVSDKIAEVLANPLPNMTVDGVVIDRMSYYRQLLEMQEAIRQQMLMAQGPFTLTSVAR